MQENVHSPLRKVLKDSVKLLNLFIKIIVASGQARLAKLLPADVAYNIEINHRKNI